jgi:hypothetical protein
MRVDQITPEVLGVVSEMWEEERLVELTRSQVVELGGQLRQAQKTAREAEVWASRVDLQCMMRARRLARLDFDREEIRELFGVNRRTINRWLKEVE